MPTYISTVEINGFRSLNGSVDLGPGLNIIIGPNASGKTTLLEAVLTAAVLSFEDLQTSMSQLLLPHAARGSEAHSLSSTVPGGEAEACITAATAGGSMRGCVELSKALGMESRGLELVGVVDVKLRPRGRRCAVTIRLGPGSFALQAQGVDCPKRVKDAPAVALLTSGIMPHGMFDTILGNLKRVRPASFERLRLALGDKEYRVEVAADEWNRLASYIVEGGTMVSFYSTGRGLQRAFQMLTLLELYDVVLVDEVENSMHPELLEEVASRLAEYSKRRQIVVTTQSLEAARILAAKVAGIPKPRMLEPVACSTEMEEELEHRLNLLVLRRDGPRIASALLRGCSALSHILGTPDVRLSYTLVGSQ